MSRRAKKSKVVNAEEEGPKTLLQQTPTPRDACLRNADLLETILDCVQDPPPPYNRYQRYRRPTLRAAALTCKAFYPTAVKLLWESPPSLLPLLGLLSTFELSGNQYVIPGMIMESEWILFDRHAAYVREFEYRADSESPSYSDKIINPSVYVRLAMHKQPLFPNIQRLTVNSKSGYPDAATHLFLSPSVTSLTLKTWATSYVSAKQPFLALFMGSTPNITYLSLKKHRSLSLSACKAFQKLKTLVLCEVADPVTAATLVEIGSIPFLQSLTTDLHNWDQVDFESIPLGSIFCALTHLETNYSSRAAHALIPAFLLRIGAPAAQVLKLSPAEKFKYSLEYLSEKSDDTSIFSNVAQCLGNRWGATLTHLELSTITASFDDLHPLQNLTQLRSVALGSVLFESIADKRVTSLFRSWAALESLTITGKAIASLPFLAALAAYCPLLGTLRLAWLHTHLPSVPQGSVRARTHALRELCFEDAKLPSKYSSWNSVDMHLLAQHLYCLFPQIEVLKGEGEGEEWERNWKTVHGLLQMCQFGGRVQWEK